MRDAFILAAIINLTMLTKNITQSISLRLPFNLRLGLYLEVGSIQRNMLCKYTNQDVFYCIVISN